MDAGLGEPGDELSAGEAARLRRRDRARSTRMVVDNAGIRRLLLDRAARQERPRPPAEETGPPG